MVKSAFSQFSTNSLLYKLLYIISFNHFHIVFHRLLSPCCLPQTLRNHDKTFKLFNLRQTACELNSSSLLRHRWTNRNLAIPIIDCTRNKYTSLTLITWTTEKIFILDGTENDVMGVFLLLAGFFIAVTSPVSKF